MIGRIQDMFQWAQIPYNLWVNPELIQEIEFRVNQHRSWRYKQGHGKVNQLQCDVDRVFALPDLQSAKNNNPFTIIQSNMNAKLNQHKFYP